MTDEAGRRNWLQYSTAGVEFIVTFALPLAGGLLLDRRIGTAPLFTVYGAAVGFALGLYRLRRQGRQVQPRRDKRSDEGQGPAH